MIRLYIYEAFVLVLSSCIIGLIVGVIIGYTMSKFFLRINKGVKLFYERIILIFLSLTRLITSKRYSALSVYRYLNTFYLPYYNNAGCCYYSNGLCLYEHLFTGKKCTQETDLLNNKNDWLKLKNFKAATVKILSL
jgi:hypothetical protein